MQETSMLSCQKVVSSGLCDSVHNPYMRLADGGRMIAAGKDESACLVESCLLHNGRGGQYLRHENIEAYLVSVSSVCSVGEVILGVVEKTARPHYNACRSQFPRLSSDPPARLMFQQ